MESKKKYFVRRSGSSFSTTQASSSGAFVPKASDGWHGFETADERRAWMDKQRRKGKL